MAEGSKILFYRWSPRWASQTEDLFSEKETHHNAKKTLPTA